MPARTGPVDPRLSPESSRRRADWTSPSCREGPDRKDPHPPRKGEGAVPPGEVTALLGPNTVDELSLGLANTAELRENPGILRPACLPRRQASGRLGRQWES
jgi:hypothetical protein